MFLVIYGLALNTFVTQSMPSQAVNFERKPKIKYAQFYDTNFSKRRNSPSSGHPYALLYLRKVAIYFR